MPNSVQSQKAMNADGRYMQCRTCEARNTTEKKHLTVSVVVTTTMGASAVRESGAVPTYLLLSSRTATFKGRSWQTCNVNVAKSDGAFVRCPGTRATA